MGDRDVNQVDLRATRLKPPAILEKADDVRGLRPEMGSQA